MVFVQQFHTERKQKKRENKDLYCKIPLKLNIRDSKMAARGRKQKACFLK
jgi:hypothetical protein